MGVKVAQRVAPLGCKGGAAGAPRSVGKFHEGSMAAERQTIRVMGRPQPPDDPSHGPPTTARRSESWAGRGCAWTGVMLDKDREAIRTRNHELNHGQPCMACSTRTRRRCGNEANEAARHTARGNDKEALRQHSTAVTSAPCQLGSASVHPQPFLPCRCCFVSQPSLLSPCRLFAVSFRNLHLASSPAFLLYRFAAFLPCCLLFASSRAHLCRLLISLTASMPAAPASRLPSSRCSGILKVATRTLFMWLLPASRLPSSKCSHPRIPARPAPRNHAFFPAFLASPSWAPALSLAPARGHPVHPTQGCP